MIHSRSAIGISLALLVIAAIAASVFFLTPDEAAAPKSASEPGISDAPFYVTTMTHMESNFKDDKDEDLFDRHVGQIRWAMDLFDEYGAKLTIESEASFARAHGTWGTNALKEVVTRGHGVGTHADFGGQRRPIEMAEYTKRFQENKSLVDALVGAENNRGVSGGQGAGDWVTAATNAGFGYIDGVVGFAYLSMPMSARPDGWSDVAIRSTYYHDNAPEDLEQRTHPFWLADSSDFLEDKDGKLLVNGGDMGELTSLAEGRSNCFPDCALTSADVDALETALKEALALHDGSRVGKINVHIPLKLFDKAHETVLREMLSMLKEYAETRAIRFGTQIDVYETAVAER